MSGPASTDLQQKPDLIFYYTINLGEGEETFTFNNSDKTKIFHNLTRPLFAEPELKNKIGDLLSILQKFPNGDAVFDTSVSFNFGTIFAKSFLKGYKNFLEPNYSADVQIIGGDNHFVNSRGYIKNITNDTSVRKVEVYFTHNK